MKHNFNSLSKAFFIGLILSIVPTSLSAKEVAKKQRKKSAKQCVDYIVIGSCAGAVVAKRLSDDNKTSVLLLEAGDDNNNDPLLQDTSLSFVAADLGYPEFAYQARAAIQPQLGGGFYDWGNARIKGGGSSHNGLQVVFGSQDYWAKVQAIAGDDWSVAKVFNRYKALESYQYEGPGEASPTRGTQGPWTNVTTPAMITEDANYLLNALIGVSGLPEIQDYNNQATPVGPFARWDMQQQFDNDYARESAATAFLSKNVVSCDGFGENGRKLRLLVRATATSFIWDKNDSTKVIGVRYSYNGKSHDVYANKEVILSAGIQSAPFLQRNGIGPKRVLENAGVPVRVANEQVGVMKNHVGLFTLFFTPGAQLRTADSPWAIFAPSAFLPATLPATPDQPREIQYIIFDGTLVGAPGLMAVFPVLLNPLSVGTVNIQNNDPFKVPLMDNGYLTNLADEETLIAALKTGVLGLAEYFQKNPPPANPLNPNRDPWVLVSPSPDLITSCSPQDCTALDAYIRTNLAQAYHYQETALLGTDPSQSVVDPRGRVHGVKNLRVADVSILPLVDGNTCTPAILVGWTIAEFILEEQANTPARG